MTNCAGHKSLLELSAANDIRLVWLLETFLAMQKKLELTVRFLMTQF